MIVVHDDMNFIEPRGTVIRETTTVFQIACAVLAVAIVSVIATESATDRDTRLQTLCYVTYPQFKGDMTIRGNECVTKQGHDWVPVSNVAYR